MYNAGEKHVVNLIRVTLKLFYFVIIIIRIYEISACTFALLRTVTSERCYFPHMILYVATWEITKTCYTLHFIRN